MYNQEKKTKQNVPEFFVRKVCISVGPEKNCNGIENNRIRPNGKRTGVLGFMFSATCPSSHNNIPNIKYFCIIIFSNDKLCKYADLSTSRIQLLPRWSILSEHLRRISCNILFYRVTNHKNIYILDSHMDVLISQRCIFLLFGIKFEVSRVLDALTLLLENRFIMNRGWHVVASWEKFVIQGLDDGLRDTDEAHKNLDLDHNIMSYCIEYCTKLLKYY